MMSKRQRKVVFRNNVVFGGEGKTFDRPPNSTLIWYHIRDLKLSHTVGLASPQ